MDARSTCSGARRRRRSSFVSPRRLWNEPGRRRRRLARLAASGGPQRLARARRRTFGLRGREARGVGALRRVCCRRAGPAHGRQSLCAASRPRGRLRDCTPRALCQRPGSRRPPASPLPRRAPRDTWRHTTPSQWRRGSRRGNRARVRGGVWPHRDPLPHMHRRWRTASCCGRFRRQPSRHLPPRRGRDISGCRRMPARGCSGRGGPGGGGAAAG
mmetsp:Transcript_7727/g.22648  ORF Transcript_7727/g.22648 Transcript_7727/m.22648 type:complete len:215 (+) Transcript_7727:1159-1803(+)